MPSTVLKVPDSSSPSEWAVYAGERNCYCGIWATNPKMFDDQGLPRGFCGKCMRCGANGHARHFPGPVPFTGAWCDRCYLITGLTYPLRTPLGWIAIAILAFAIFVLVRALG